MLDMELQDVLFALLGFGLTLVSLFFPMLPFLPLQNGSVCCVPLFIGSMKFVSKFIASHS